MDGMLFETEDEDRPVAFNRVRGILTGKEYGAHHCIAEMAGAVNDIGYTVPGQAWTYWNTGPGPGDEEYLSPDELKLRARVDAPDRRHEGHASSTPPPHSRGTRSLRLSN